MTLRQQVTVSTHSRPKAAGRSIWARIASSPRFNTQPPEGGWRKAHGCLTQPQSFNTQPPEGGWPVYEGLSNSPQKFQHTAARRRLDNFRAVRLPPKAVSTHSRPKAAGWATCRNPNQRRFNTQPPEGGWALILLWANWDKVFQHTAARRRLVFIDESKDETKYSFNTQPPEGGWMQCKCLMQEQVCFNTQPPEGGWLWFLYHAFFSILFQHTAARRRLVYSNI